MIQVLALVGGSSSSYYSSSSWDSDYSGDSSSDEGLIFGIILLIVFIFVATKSRGSNEKNQYYSTELKSASYKNLDFSQISKIDKELVPKEFMLKAFEIYKDIQIAWMNFDTDTIRNLTTDELYNMYSSQLEALKLKKQKNIMKDISLEDVKIIDISQESDVIEIKVYLRVKCFDYVIDENTCKTVRGNDSKKLNIEYELSFVKSAVDISDEPKCPSCGTEVTMNSSAVCPYCHSTLVRVSNKYVMSKKTCVGQSLE